MKKTYTKAQIQEALSYWTKMLNEGWMTDGNVTRWFSPDDMYDARKDGFEPCPPPVRDEKPTPTGPHRMDAREYHQFINDLNRGIVTFTFQKKDGSVKTVKGTTCPDAVDGPKPFAPRSCIGYFDIEADGWRMFKADNFISRESNVEKVQPKVQRMTYDEAFAATAAVQPTEDGFPKSDGVIKWMIEHDMMTTAYDASRKTVDVKFTFPFVYKSSDGKEFPNAAKQFSIRYSETPKHGHHWLLFRMVYLDNDAGIQKWGNFWAIEFNDGFPKDVLENWPLLKAVAQKETLEKIPDLDPATIDELWTKECDIYENKSINDMFN